MIDDPLRRPLREIAAAVRTGALDPVELAERAREAAENAASLNAFTVLSLAPTVGRDGALAGVPYAAKDAIATKSLPTCAGSPALADWRPPEDAAAILSLAKAGATLIGKTNMHELSFGVTSNNHAFGPVRNPYAPNRIAGGSSGGSAVAVAIGAVPFALAADTGGSARIPAALCGLVGFRPTTGRWPNEGLIKVSPTRDTIGAIVRQLDDVLLLDTVFTGDVTTHPIPPVRALRLGLPIDPYFIGLDPDVAAAVDRFLDRLLQAGAVVVQQDGRTLHEREAACGFLIALHEAGIEMTTLAAGVGLDLNAFAERIASPDVRDIVSSLALPGDEGEYQRALGTNRSALQRAYTALFSNGLDALVMPTTVLPAARIGDDDVVMLNGKLEPTFSIYARQTSPASVAGIPSVSIPIGCTEGGLPLGILVEGPAGTDRRLLTTAIALSAFTEPVAPPVLASTAARREC